MNGWRVRRGLLFASLLCALPGAARAQKAGAVDAVRPQAGIQRGAPGTYVYVVNADQTVSVRTVTLGPGDATNVSISKGLAPGERVVVDGADKLRDGAKVLLRQRKGGGAPGTGPAPASGQGQGGHRHQPRSSQSGG